MYPCRFWLANKLERVRSKRFPQKEAAIAQFDEEANDTKIDLAEHVFSCFVTRNGGAFR
jgi:hypothetical protein